MIFADLMFLYVFLPLCLIVYLAANSVSRRNAVLIAVSLIFYAWGEPVWVILLILSSFTAYIGAVYVSIYNRKGDEHVAKIILTISIVLLLGLLFIFKYSGFVIENINSIFHTHFAVKKYKLPIGISFYTFQTLSYLLDVYWGKIKPQPKFHKVLLYISLFPQLIAGPIVRYNNISEEINFRKISAKDYNEGFTRIIVGLAKKVIIANNLHTVVADIYGGDISHVSILGTWLGAALFALQVYFDFSGYSDMAIGLGRLFGFHFDENFKHPFISKDIQEFWQRWHISLGSFFKDYLLYVPIFGKRRKYGGLLLVWLCTGLWHGASWNFIIWGLFFGSFIMIETFLGKKRMKKFNIFAKHIYTKIVLIIGFGIFYFENNSELGTFFLNLFGLNHNGFADDTTLLLFANNIFLIIAAVLLSTPLMSNLKQKYENKPETALTYAAAQTAANVVLLVVSSILLVGATNNAFLYYRF